MTHVVEDTDPGHQQVRTAIHPRSSLACRTLQDAAETRVRPSPSSGLRRTTTRPSPDTARDEAGPVVGRALGRRQGALASP